MCLSKRLGYILFKKPAENVFVFNWIQMHDKLIDEENVGQVKVVHSLKLLF